MTKWQCRCEKHWCRVETSVVTPDSCLYDRHTNPRWKRVDEPPLKDAPPFTRDEQSVTYDRNRIDIINLGNDVFQLFETDKNQDAILRTHEANLLEMAGNLAALKERMDLQDDKILNLAGGLDKIEERVVLLENYKRWMQESTEGVIHSLLERVEALENQPCAAAIDHLNLRQHVKKLEHQMKLMARHTHETFLPKTREDEQ